MELNIKQELFDEIHQEIDHLWNRKVQRWVTFEKWLDLNPFTTLINRIRREKFKNRKPNRKLEFLFEYVVNNYGKVDENSIMIPKLIRDEFKNVTKDIWYFNGYYFIITFHPESAVTSNYIFDRNGHYVMKTVN
jgi:hypothetical protein